MLRMLTLGIITFIFGGAAVYQEGASDSLFAPHPLSEALISYRN